MPITNKTENGQICNSHWYPRLLILQRAQPIVVGNPEQGRSKSQAIGPTENLEETGLCHLPEFLGLLELGRALRSQRDIPTATIPLPSTGGTD